MKLKFTLYFLLVLFIPSCSKDDSGEPQPDPQPEPVTENKAPSVPSLKFPEDETECLYSGISFEWQTAEDPEGEQVHYELEISKDREFGTLAFSKSTRATTAYFDLEQGSVYYWRVRAKDTDYLGSGYSAVRSLFTEPDLIFNHLPYSPSAENPADNGLVTKNTVLLEWKSEDPDGDALLYDLYFGKVNPPELIKENLTNDTYEITLTEDTTYYWKVVAKDGKGAVAVGNIWSFEYSSN